MTPVYLDCNATTPLEPEVLEETVRFFTEEYGNEGSRTHSFGARAKQSVQTARDQVASLVSAKRDEVIFTSGATESNNLALCGLKQYGLKEGKTHLVTTAIEHKAVLEPLQSLEKEGFEVEYVSPNSSGQVEPEAIANALRPETLLVSAMQVNNETGIRQPITEIAELLKGHPAFFHTDAAQGFGKEIETLRSPRIDLISISGHKIFAPKGIGALVMRRRGYKRPPLEPLMVGGGQERGLRPGTLPVGLIAALGKASEIAVRDHDTRLARCREIRKEALTAFSELDCKFSGDQNQSMDHVLNLSFGGIDSEALMVALKDLIAISNGSACTSSSYTPSHVLEAMGMTEEEANCCVRLSWSHLTPDVNWMAVRDRIKKLM